jgi:hypothetical protein
MKSIFAAAAMTVILAAPAFSQSSTTITTTTPGASQSITLAPEQRARIKQYVVQEKVKPFAAKERFTVGATLPADVELLAVPGSWGPEVSRYRYVYSNDNVVLVEPSSRRVVQIID